MLVWIDIRKNDTGEIRRRPGAEEWHGGDDTPDYWWVDGNAGCDCNRCLFFMRVKGEPEDECDCGEGGFSIRATDTATGQIIYSEFDR